MNELRKAAEMALKYFEDAYGLEDAEVAIKEALRQALVQPEQKYVIDCPRCGHCCPEREWVGMTDEEVIKCFDSVAFGQVEDDLIINKHVNIFRAIHGIEAKLKEKNT